MYQLENNHYQFKDNVKEIIAETKWALNYPMGSDRDYNDSILINTFWNVINSNI